VGTAADRAGEVGVQSAIGPRVYIPGAFLEETGLVGVGSLVNYQTYLRYDGDADRFRRERREFFREHRVRVETAQGQVESMVRTIGTLGSFLALVGLTALLLGGVAVASAVNLFVEERLTAVAVLRCLGADQRSILAAYLAQAGALGLAGAMVGAAGGVFVQAILPRVLEGLVPVGVRFALHWPSILTGLGVGLWVALVAALLPLLRVREVAPVQALRREAAAGGRAGPDRWRRVAYLLVEASVVALSIAQAPGWRSGLSFALAIAFVLGLLYLTARLIVGAMRRCLPRRAGYTLRQGVANLFRPRNQTVAVVLSLGFGVFLIGIIFLAQHSILDRFQIDAAAGRPNLLLFDLQPDQRAGVEALLGGRGIALQEVTPLVPGRIAAINGRSAAELRAEREGERPSGWALRREYRNTYRAHTVETERVVAGEWWGGGERAGEGRISVEEEHAGELGIGVGDRVTWDFQGVEIETEVSSLRAVEWAQFAPNFFVVFEPGILEAAPQTLIALARVEDPESRAVLQRDLVLDYPNISVLDLTVVQVVVDELLGKVGLAVRFLAFFAVAVGVIVLIGALRASRVHRLRESVLLRTLGASRRQIRGILLAEYLTLGALAGVAGILFATVAAWPLVTKLFQLDYTPPLLHLAGAWIGLSIATATVGMLNSRGATQRSPLAVLREGSE
jgi:putative ABC transport system permease protein